MVTRITVVRTVITKETAVKTMMNETAVTFEICRDWQVIGVIPRIRTTSRKTSRRIPVRSVGRAQDDGPVAVRVETQHPVREGAD